MEATYLNFHDAETFSDYALSLDQRNLLNGSEGSFSIDDDFDYKAPDLSANFWGTEQELNGDLAVLPMSGVSSIIPKIEPISDGFAFAEWHDHMGLFEGPDMDDDISQGIDYSMDLTDPLDLPINIFQDDVHFTSPIKRSPSVDNVNSNYDCNSSSTSSFPIKIETPIKIELQPKIEKIESEDCVDVETIPEHEPVLEAGDVKSLLEQFEASEASAVRPIVNKKMKASTKSAKKIFTENARSCANKSKQMSVKKSSEESKPKKHHKHIEKSLPKEVIDRIKASTKKNKSISMIPAMTNSKNGGRSSGKKKIDTPVESCNAGTNAGKPESRIKSNSVQHDHDYYSKFNYFVTAANSRKKYDPKLTRHKNVSPIKIVMKSTVNKSNSLVLKVDEAPVAVRKDLLKRADSWTDNNSKKDSGLESSDVSDCSEGPAVAQDQRVVPTGPVQPRDASSSVNNKNISSTLSKSTPIRSSLATSILQMRKGIGNKKKSLPVDSNIHKGKQMISVLKKPPVASAASNPTESIVTTQHSSNDEVQNDCAPETAEKEEKKPPRKKLNLAEYRNRRDLGKSDSSRTNSPVVQPTTLVYIHHVATTTEPITDDFNNPVWAEKEIISVLKPKSEVEEAKNRPKPETREVAIQTHETVFNICLTSQPNSEPIGAVDTHEPGEIETTDEPEAQATTNELDKSTSNRLHDRKLRSYRRCRDSSSSSRSRSRSRNRRSSSSRSRSRSSSRSRRRGRSVRRRRRSTSSQSRYSRSRSRSYSRSLSRRRRARQRRISHRRSSVSTNSNWSSRCRSRSYSRSRSRLRSRSRSSRSSSSRSLRSSASSRLSCSSRSVRSSFQRRRRSRPRSPGGRQRRDSSGSYYKSYRDRRRSPSYRNSVNPWYNQEKDRPTQERRVIYVGRIEDGITKAQIRRRFEAFGPVEDIKLYFREHRDNYGFVTFVYKNDAFEAVAHGNDDASLPSYDLCFGGRRDFCKVKYADLDGAANSEFAGGRNYSNESNSFDILLKEAQAKLRNRKV